MICENEINHIVTLPFNLGFPFDMWTPHPNTASLDGKGTMRETDRQELTERFLAVAEFINRQTHFHRLDAWEELGMTIPQLRTLVLLEQMEPMRMGSISTHLDRALSATTTVVDRLVEKGLVARSSDPDDRRVVLCELTELGRSTIDRLWRVGTDRIEMIMDVLEPEQIETVLSALDLLLRAEGELGEAH